LPQATTDTLIVSDLHLGIPASRPGALLEVLEGWRFGRLILLGDIFHDFAFANFGTDCWRLLRHVRGLALDNGAEVIWIKGNHDRDLGDLVLRLVGVRMRESYRWDCGGRSHLALHGDRFDRFITNNRRLCRRLSAVYGFCQRRLSREGRWPAALDRWHGRMFGIGDEVAGRAARFAALRSADVVVCGHTHEPGHWHFPGQPGVPRPVDYYNSGSWVARPASFLAVDAGRVRIERCP
jgi:UDP-2,3-diacylglucosamine pyrophosphatase LpxH